MELGSIPNTTKTNGDLSKEKSVISRWKISKRKYRGLTFLVKLT